MIILIIAIIVMIVVIVVIKSNASKMISQPTLTNGNLRFEYKQFVTAVNESFPGNTTLLRDDNQKIVYRAFSRNSQDQITGEYLFTLRTTNDGHYVLVSYRSGNGKTFSSNKIHFLNQQSVYAYKDVIVQQALPLSFKALI